MHFTNGKYSNHNVQLLKAIVSEYFHPYISFEVGMVIPTGEKDYKPHLVAYASFNGMHYYVEHTLNNYLSSAKLKTEIDYAVNVSVVTLSLQMLEVK